MLKLLTPEQMDRYEAFRRSKLAKPSMRKVQLDPMPHTSSMKVSLNDLTILPECRCHDLHAENAKVSVRVPSPLISACQHSTLLVSSDLTLDWAQLPAQRDSAYKVYYISEPYDVILHVHAVAAQRDRAGASYELDHRHVRHSKALCGRSSGDRYSFWALSCLLLCHGPGCIRPASWLSALGKGWSQNAAVPRLFGSLSWRIAGNLHAQHGLQAFDELSITKELSASW